MVYDPFQKDGCVRGRDLERRCGPEMTPVSMRIEDENLRWEYAMPKIKPSHLLENAKDVYGLNILDAQVAREKERFTNGENFDIAEVVYKKAKESFDFIKDKVLVEREKQIHPVFPGFSRIGTKENDSEREKDIGYRGGCCGIIILGSPIYQAARNSKDIIEFTCAGCDSVMHQEDTKLWKQAD